MQLSIVSSIVDSLHRIVIDQSLHTPVVEELQEMFVTLHVAPVQVVEPVTRCLYFLLQIGGQPHCLMQDYHDQNDEETSPRDAQGDQEEYVPKLWLEGRAVSDGQTLNQAYQGGEGNQVHQVLNEGDLAVGWDLLADDRNDSDECKHQPCQILYSPCQQGGLIEDAHVDDAEQPQGDKDGGDGRVWILVEGDDEVRHLEMFHLPEVHLLLLGLLGLVDFVRMGSHQLGRCFVRVLGLQHGGGDAVVAKFGLGGEVDLVDVILTIHTVEGESDDADWALPAEVHVVKLVSYILVFLDELGELEISQDLGVDGEDEVGGLEGRPEYIGNEAGGENLLNFEVQVVVEEAIVLHLYLLIDIHLHVFVFLLEFDGFVVIEEDHHIAFDELDELPLQPGHVDGEVEVTVEFGLQHCVVDVGDAVHFDAGVGRQDEVKGPLVLLVVDDLVGAPRQHLLPDLAEHHHLLQVDEVGHFLSSNYYNLQNQITFRYFIYRSVFVKNTQRVNAVTKKNTTRVTEQINPMFSTTYFLSPTESSYILQPILMNVCISSRLIMIDRIASNPPSQSASSSCSQVQDYMQTMVKFNFHFVPTLDFQVGQAKVDDPVG